jgi:hypothetical protein
MHAKKMILFAIGAASLALPAATGAAAQPYYRPDYDRPNYDQPNDGGPHGDWYGRRRRDFQGYPEFQGVERHIWREIQEGVRDDMIEADDARDLMNQLQRIRRWETREFQIHGWSLPDDDRARLRDRLDQLDRLVDQVRAEP